MDEPTSPPNLKSLVIPSVVQAVLKQQMEHNRPAVCQEVNRIFSQQTQPHRSRDRTRLACQILQRVEVRYEFDLYLLLADSLWYQAFRQIENYITSPTDPNGTPSINNLRKLLHAIRYEQPGIQETLEIQRIGFRDRRNCNIVERYKRFNSLDFDDLAQLLPNNWVSNFLLAAILQSMPDITGNARVWTCCDDSGLYAQFQRPGSLLDAIISNSSRQPNFKIGTTSATVDPPAIVISGVQDSHRLGCIFLRVNQDT